MTNIYPLYHFYPEFELGLKKELTIRHLLTHTSGLPSFIEYYKKDDFNSKSMIVQDIITQTLTYKPDEKVIYSDLGMILLMEIAEKVSSKSIDKMSSSWIYNPLGMNATMYNPSDHLLSQIVPTEYDVLYRKKLRN